MNVNLAPMTWGDREQVIDIFNYYVENTFAAYPDRKVPYEFFDMLLNMCEGYPSVTAKNPEGDIVGFGMLRPYSPIPSFSRTAEITYFLKFGFTGQGIGKALLEYLVTAGKGKDLTSILASVSSLNELSINFHVRNGFTERGRLLGVGRKKGRDFDVIYFQKML